MGNKIDLLNASLRNGMQPVEAIDYMSPEDVVELRDRKFYDQYSNKNQKDNPNAPSDGQIDALYAQASKVKQLSQEGYYKPRMVSELMSPFTSIFSTEYSRPFSKRMTNSSIPFVSDPQAPGFARPTMNLDRDAYESNWFAIPNEKSPKGYDKITKEPGWEKLPGKFVFEADPETNGSTKMMTLVDDYDETAGRQQLNVFSPPQEFVSNYFKAIGANMLAAIPRLGKDVAIVSKSINQFNAKITGENKDIFNDEKSYADYINKIYDLAPKASDKKILDDALASGNQDAILKAFNFVEYQLPVYERSELNRMRMPEHYNRANGRFNDMIDVMESWENPKIEELNRGYFDSVGTFLYQTAGVVADLIPQMAASMGGAALGGKLLGKVAAKGVFSKSAEFVAKNGSQIGSMFMGGMVGGGQAIGSTVEAMNDAGFSLEEQAKVLPWIAIAMPLTEGLVSGGWMGRYLSRDVLQTYKESLTRKFAEKIATTEGKLAAGDAMELGRHSVMQFWNNPKFRDFVQKSYWSRELPIVTALEGAQEVSEDLIYNVTNLYNNKQRPEYYKGVIDSGINDWWGDDGVFNGKQMLQTLAITALATGISDVGRTAMTGRFKPGGEIRAQDIAASSWAADQAAKGNSQIFLDMGKDEMKKDDSLFGSRKTKLADLGVEPIVLEGAAAQRYANSNLGVYDATKGTITIDNMADANYLNFLEKVTMMKDLAEKHGLDGKTVNSKMLHELIDVNGTIMSTAALDKAIDLKEANEQLTAFNEEHADISKYTPEQTKQYESDLKALEEIQLIAKDNLSQYTTIEEGTNYSKAVNDTVKMLLTTYNVAEEKTLEQLKAEKINLKDKKQYNALKSQWEDVLSKKHNYEQVNNLITGMKDIKLRMQQDNKNMIADLEKAKDNKFENLDLETETLTKSFEKVLNTKEDKTFVKMMSGVNSAFKTLEQNILSTVKTEFMNPALVNGMYEKFSSMYDQAYERLTGIMSKDTDGMVDKLTAAGMSENFANSMETMMGTSVDYTQDAEFLALPKKKQKVVAGIIDEVSTPFNADMIGMNALVKPNLNEQEFETNIQEAITKLQQPVSIMDAYNELLNKISTAYQNAVDVVDSTKDNSNNPFLGVDSKIIAGVLDSYAGLVDNFENSYDISSRLAGKPQFKQHSDEDEQMVIESLADEKKKDSLVATVNTIRANRVRFGELSGLSDLSSVDSQQEKKAIFLTAQVRNMRFILDIVNANQEIVPIKMIEELNAFDIRSTVKNAKGEDVEIINLKGDYSDTVLANIRKVERSMHKIIDLLKTKGVMSNPDIRTALLQPFVVYQEKSNPKKGKGETFTSAVGFDGSFNRGAQSVYDIMELRKEAAQKPMSDLLTHDGDIAFRSTRMQFVEMLQQYASMLALVEAPVSMNKINNARKKLNIDKQNPSTYEQEMVENTVIAFMADGKILKDIYAISEQFASTDIIRNGIIIPGDYGTGKTQHVLRRAFKIYSEIGSTKFKYAFFAPSMRLKATHQETFNNGLADDRFKMFSQLASQEAVPEGTNQVIVVDEGSLLSSGIKSSEIDILKNIEKSSKGTIKIIILADLNQMRSLSEMNENNGHYPSVMSYAFKTTMLTEQFSTNSPIIKAHASYWQRKASNRNMAADLKTMPMGYTTKVDGRNMGVQYSESESSVITSFMASSNTSKALIFEDQKHFDAYMSNASDEIKQALKSKDNNPKIFFIHYDKTISDRVIQGLREQEIYIVSNPSNMYFHTHKSTKVINDYVAIYTAIGRAQTYVNMNLGTEAKNHMTSDPLQAAPVGDITGENKYAKEKIDKMIAANTVRFDEMGLKDEMPAQTEDKKGLEKPKLTGKGRPGETAITGDVTIFDNENNELKVNFVLVPLENKKTRYDFMVTIDGQTISLEPMIKEGSRANMKEIGVGAQDSYHAYMDDQAPDLTQAERIPVNEVVIFGTTYTMGDIYQAGEITALTTNKKNSINDRYVEVTTPDGKTLSFTSNTIANIGKKVVISEEEDTDLAKPVTKVFMSQSLAWKDVNAVYNTSHFLYAPDGQFPKEEDIPAIYAMHGFLLNHVAEFGLPLQLIYKNDQWATNPLETKQFPHVLMTRVNMDAKAMKAFLSDDRLKRLKPGYVKDVITKLQKSKNPLKDFEMYAHVSAMALPLANPVGLYGKTALIRTTIENNFDTAIETIKKNYSEAIAQTTDPAKKTDLRLQMEAQVGITNMYLSAMANHDENGVVDMDNSMIEVFPMQVKVEYGLTDETQSIQEFVESMDKQAIYFENDNALGSTVANEDKQLVGSFSVDPLDDTPFHFTLKTPLLNNERLAGRVTRLYDEDNKALAKMKTDNNPRNKGNQDLYDAYDNMITDLHVYHVIMSNKNNFLNLRKDGLNATINGEYREYFTFDQKNGRIRFNGKTLAERKENIEAVAEMIFNSEWTAELFDYVAREKLSGDKKGKVVLSDDQYIYTNAKRINHPHFFVSYGPMAEAITPEITTKEPEVVIKSNPKRRTKLETATPETNDTQYISKNVARNIIQELLGEKYSKSMLHFVNGMINHQGHLATGMVIGDEMLLAETEKGVRFTSPYHETLHIVWNNILDPRKMAQYRRLARKVAFAETGKILVGIKLEEWAARNFADYVQNVSSDEMIEQALNININDEGPLTEQEKGIWGFFRGFMNKIMNFFMRHREELNSFYDDILKGKYTDAPLNGTENIRFEDADETGPDRQTTDKIEKYLQLKDEIKQSFPGNRGLIEKMVERTKYDLINYSPLSNIHNFDNYSLLDSIHSVIADNEDFSAEMGREIVDVVRNGGVVSMPISEVPMDEYENIFSKSKEYRTKIAKNKAAQESYRTWHLLNKKNTQTILQHILPEYDPENDSVARGKLFDGIYDRTDLDPHRDGFTAEMKLQLGAIPSVTMKNGGLVINTDNPQFIDQRFMIDLIKEIGTNAKIYFDQEQAKGTPISHLEAFSLALTNHMNNYGLDIDGKMGSYVSPITAALKAFETRFMGNEGSTFMDQYGDSYAPLRSIAIDIYQQSRDNRNNKSALDAMSDKMRRAEQIMSFLSTMASTGISSVITRNAKMTIYGNENESFNYTFTEYNNNHFDGMVNRIKNNFDNKFNNGLLTSEKIINQLKKYVTIGKDGNINLGMNGTIPFITRSADGKVYSFNAMVDNSGTMNEGLDARINQLLIDFNVIRKTIGLTDDVLPNTALKAFLKNSKFTGEMKAVAKKLQEEGYGDTYANFKNDPRKFLAATIANIIYAYKAQITPFNMTFDYTLNGVSKNYNQTTDLLSHRKAIKSLVGNDKDVQTFTMNGTAINKEEVIKNILPHALSTNGLPMIGYLQDYMKKIGATAAYKSSNENEVLTSEGITLPIPSQFFPAIDIIASQVSSVTGNIGGTVQFRPDGKKVHTLQGRNMYNNMINGSGEMVSNIKTQVELDPSLKKDSPLYNADGTPLSPYLMEGDGKATLDHISDFFGMERDYGGMFQNGTKDITPHDFVVMSVNTFLNRIQRTTDYVQIIAVPTMTISSTGKIYMLNHRFSAAGNIIKLVGVDKKQIMLNYDATFDQVANEAQRIERQIQIARSQYTSVMGQINTLLKPLKKHIPTPVDGEVVGKNTLTWSKFRTSNDQVILRAMNGLPADMRAQVMEIVRGSHLRKGLDIVIDEEAQTFKLGSITSDNIKNVSKEENTPGIIYSDKNRKLLLAKNVANKEQVLKTVFHDDFVNAMDYMADLGYSADRVVARTAVTAGNTNGFNSKKTFYDQKDPMLVNEAMFAFYMMFHISNNLFDNIIGGSINYKGVMDQVKRLGPFNTPKQSLNTNVKVGGINIGSLNSQHKFIAINDTKLTVKITDTMSEEIEEAFNGQSILNPQLRPMFDISSGGKHYSISGEGSMIKTLTTQIDPITGEVLEVKHAAKFITEENFQNSQAYRNMVMDLYKAQDQALYADGAFYELVQKSRKYRDFSWTQRFTKYYDQTQSMNQAVRMLFDDMRNIQYELQGEETISQDGQKLYDLLSASVMYGYNPLSTIKTPPKAYNDYDSRPETYKAPAQWAFESIDFNQTGTILNSEQPMDDSRMQAGFQQTEAFAGNSDFSMDNIYSKLYDKNPGIAINKIKKEIYEEAIALINTKIGNTKPKGIDRGINQPSFSEIDWKADDILDDKRDLSYAVAQFEWYMRDLAKKGLVESSVQGNYVEMLADGNITREIPQMRNKMVQNYRQHINREAVKHGMTGMRVVQASGLFHEFYELKNSTDTMVFTREEALEHLDLQNKSIADFEKLEPELLKSFTKRGIKDMRVENGVSKHGEIVMPYIFAKKLGVRMKGFDGATRNESVRDLFTLTFTDGKVNVSEMDEQQILDTIKAAVKRNAISQEFFDSFIIRKAIEPLFFDKQRLKNMEADGITKQEMIPYILEDIANGKIDLGFMYKHASEIKDSVKKSLTVFANRVPSNRMGSGGWMNIVAFHYDGNEAYIPTGMTLLNDSDFDIDQLAIYAHQLMKDGYMSNDRIDQLNSAIMDITEEVFLSKQNQPNIFIVSSIKDLQKVADRENGHEAPINANTLHSLFKTHSENKGGADAIGIFNNTLSASSWLQSLGDNKNIILDEKSPMNNITNTLRRMVKGKESLVIMVGDWLQAALDNAKNNTLGKYGITMEAVPIAAIMIANGPSDPKMSNKEFFEEIKAFFTNRNVQQAMFDASLGSSLHYSTKDHDMYLSITKHLNRINKKLDSYKNADVTVKASVKAKGFSMVTGNAPGADTMWNSMAKKFGVGKIDVVTVNSFEELPMETKGFIDNEYRAIATMLKRRILPVTDYNGKLVRRDLLQVMNTESVLAIGQIVEPGMIDNKGYTNETSRQVVAGGTAYAVEYAIKTNKPVHVFNQDTDKWYTFKDGAFVEEGIPVITKSFTAVGTRELDPNGERAMQSVLEKTFDDATVTQKNTVVIDKPQGTINVYWADAESETNTRVLSNLAKRPFTYEDVDYGSVEHAYQTLKSGTFNEKIYNDYLKIGGYGKKITDSTQADHSISLQLMKDLVVESFMQNKNDKSVPVLMKYKNFTHNTNQAIDKAFLEGLKLAQAEITKNPEINTLAPQASDTEVNDYLNQKVMPYLNAYLSSLDIAPITSEHPDFKKDMSEYYDTLGKDTPKAEMEVIKGYYKFKRYNEAYWKHKGLLQGQEMLSRLEKLIIQAEALRGMSRILTLRNGIPATDSDFNNAKQGIEMSFGTTLNDIVKGRVATKDEFIEYFKSHSNDYVDNKDAVTRDKLVGKVLAIRDSINLPEVIKAIPMLNVYLSEMLNSSNRMGSTFMRDGKQMMELESEIQKATGFNGWKYGSQKETFHDAVTQMVLDEYMKVYQDKRISIATPENDKFGYSRPTSVFMNMDMSNIHDRQIFTLEMPNFTNQLKRRFDTRKEMEDFFTAIDVDYQGISDAFYDENGRYQGNYFMNSIDSVGRGDRLFIGLVIPSNEMSEEKRRTLMQEFDRFPKSIRNLFVLNEFIVNKLNYRRGSIIDIIGLDPYREGVSATFKTFAANIKNNQGPVFDEVLRKRLLDYIAVSDGMTKYVNKKKLLDPSNPKYVMTKEKIANRDFTVQKVYKQTLDGDRVPLFVSTPRAGLSMGVNPITSHTPISLTAEEHDQLYLNPKRSLTKTYAKGHGYVNGVYKTDHGVFVNLTVSGSDVILRVVDEPTDNGGFTIKKLYEQMNESTTDDFMEGRVEPREFSMIKTVDTIQKNKQMAQKVDMLIGNIEKAFPGLKVIRENYNSTEKKRGRGWLPGWADNEGVHFNMDAIHPQMPVHEMTHVLMAIIQQVNPVLYGQIYAKLGDYLKENPTMYQTYKDANPNKTEADIQDELMAIVGGMTSEKKVADYLAGNGVEDYEVKAKGLFGVIKTFLGNLWNAITGLFKKRFNATIFNSDIRDMTLQQIFDGFTNDILAGNEIFALNNLERDMFSNNYTPEFSEGFNSPINNFSGVAGAIINNPDPNAIMSDKTDYSKNPVSFVNMVYNRRYTTVNGSKTYVEWLGKRFQFASNDEAGIKAQIKDEILQHHIDTVDKFSNNVKDVILAHRSGRTIDEALNEIFVGTTQDGEERSRSYIAMNELKKLLEFAGANDKIVDVLSLAEFSERYKQYSGLVDNSMIAFNPLVVIHSMKKGTLEISISDISAGDLGRSKTLTGDKQKLNGRFKSSAKEMTEDSSVTWSNSKKDARAATLVLTIAAMNHFAKKEGIKLIIRRAGVYGMRGGITGSVDQRNINNMQEAMDQVHEVMQYPEMVALYKHNALMMEIVNNETAWDASNLGVAHDFELTSYYSSDSIPNDIYGEFKDQLLGKNMSVDQHMKVLRKRQAQIEKRLGLKKAIEDPEYTMIAKAILHYKKGWNVNNMNIDDISRIGKEVVNVHNIGNSLVQYASIEFEASKSAVVNRANRFSDELAKYIEASRNSDKRRSGRSDELFGHLFPEVEVIADKKYEIGSRTIQQGDKVKVKLYNQLYSSSNPNTARQLKAGKLTKEDVALADFIVKTVREQYLKNIMFQNRMRSDYTMEDAIKKFEEDYMEGSIPVIPATQEQNFGARKMKTFFSKFMNDISNSDIKWGNLMNEDFKTIHSRFVGQKSFETQLFNMGLIKTTNEKNEEIYNPFDLNATFDQSNNLEYTIKFFFMDMERAIEYGENVLPIFNDVMAISNFVDRDMGTSQVNIQTFLKEYYNLIVEHKRADQTESDNLTKKIGPMLRTGLAVNSFLSLAYRPLIWVKSAYFNEQSSYLSAFANGMANWGIKNGERLDMPTSKEVTKAHELLFTDYKKVWKLANKFQLINGNERDVLENVFSNVADRHLFKAQIAHIGNWYTDAVARALSMVSYMIMDGTYDAHVYDKKTGELTYDIKKDKRFYADEKSAEMRPGWNKVNEAIIIKQNRQGLIEDGKQIIGYDFEEINGRMKWYSDKFIIGAMDPYQKTLLGNYWAGASIAQFRGFSFDKLWNAFAIGKIRTAYGSKIVPVQDENGEWMTVEEQMEIESTLQSVISTIWELRKFDHLPLADWQKLSPIRRRNLANAAVKLVVYGLIAGALAAIGFSDRDKRKLQWMFSEVFTFNTLQNIVDNPVPFISSVTDIWKMILGQKRFEKIYRFFGPANDAVFFYELFSSNDQLVPDMKRDKKGNLGYYETAADKVYKKEQAARAKERKEYRDQIAQNMLDNA